MTCEREGIITRQLALDSKVALASDLNGSSSALWLAELGKPLIYIAPWIPCLHDEHVMTTLTG